MPGMRGPPFDRLRAMSSARPGSPTSCWACRSTAWHAWPVLRLAQDGVGCAAKVANPVLSLSKHGLARVARPSTGSGRCRVRGLVRQPRAEPVEARLGARGPSLDWLRTVSGAQPRSPTPCWACCA